MTDTVKMVLSSSSVGVENEMDILVELEVSGLQRRNQSQGSTDDDV